MLNISEGAEVLLKTGEVVTIVSGYSSWRGQRWTGKGWNAGKDIQREFSEDEVRAVLGTGMGAASRSSEVGADSGSLF